MNLTAAESAKQLGQLPFVQLLFKIRSHTASPPFQ